MKPYFLFFSLCFVMIFGIAGCTTTSHPTFPAITPPPFHFTPTPQPTTVSPYWGTCHLHVISNSSSCEGWIYLENYPTGYYLHSYGSVVIPNVECGSEWIFPSGCVNWVD